MLHYDRLPPQEKLTIGSDGEPTSYPKNKNLGCFSWFLDKALEETIIKKIEELRNSEDIFFSTDDDLKQKLEEIPDFFRTFIENIPQSNSSVIEKKTRVVFANFFDFTSYKNSKFVISNIFKYAFPDNTDVSIKAEELYFYKTTVNYPNGGFTLSQIESLNLNINDFFQSSRLRLTLDIPAGYSFVYENSLREMVKILLPLNIILENLTSTVADILRLKFILNDEEQDQPESEGLYNSYLYLRQLKENNVYHVDHELNINLTLDHIKSQAITPYKFVFTNLNSVDIIKIIDRIIEFVKIRLETNGTKSQTQKIAINWNKKGQDLTDFYFLDKDEYKFSIEQKN